MYQSINQSIDWSINQSINNFINVSNLLAVHKWTTNWGHDTGMLNVLYPTCKWSFREIGYLQSNRMFFESRGQLYSILLHHSFWYILIDSLLDQSNLQIEIQFCSCNFFRKVLHVIFCERSQLLIEVIPSLYQRGGNVINKWQGMPSFKSWMWTEDDKRLIVGKLSMMVQPTKFAGLQ